MVPQSYAPKILLLKKARLPIPEPRSRNADGIGVVSDPVGTSEPDTIKASAVITELSYPPYSSALPKYTPAGAIGERNCCCGGSR